MTAFKIIIVLLMCCSSAPVYPECTHHAKNEWDCKNLQLNSIPEEIMTKPAKRLNFAGNNIKLSSSDMNVLRNLDYRNNVTEIILESNSISTLPENLDQVLPNLERIYLSNNNITKVKYQFNKLFNLKELYLDNNPIKEIAPRAFKHLANLTMVSLNDTNYPLIKSLLKRYPNLIVQFNELDEIDDNTIKSSNKANNICDSIILIIFTICIIVFILPSSMGSIRSFP